MKRGRACPFGVDLLILRGDAVAARRGASHRRDSRCFGRRSVLVEQVLRLADVEVRRDEVRAVEVTQHLLQDRDPVRAGMSAEERPILG